MKKNKVPSRCLPQAFFKSHHKAQRERRRASDSPHPPRQLYSPHSGMKRVMSWSDMTSSHA